MRVGVDTARRPGRTSGHVSCLLGGDLSRIHPVFTGERGGVLSQEGMILLPSVPSPVTHISPTNLQNVNTIYIYTPDLSGTMFRKWVCRCCETENDATQSFCVLCGSASGRYGRGVYAFEQNYETEDPDADPFLEATSLVYHSH